MALARGFRGRGAGILIVAARAGLIGVASPYSEFRSAPVCHTQPTVIPTNVAELPAIRKAPVRQFTRVPSGSPSAARNAMIVFRDTFRCPSLIGSPSDAGEAKPKVMNAGSAGKGPAFVRPLSTLRITEFRDTFPSRVSCSKAAIRHTYTPDGGCKASITSRGGRSAPGAANVSRASKPSLFSGSMGISVFLLIFPRSWVMLRQIGRAGQRDTGCSSHGRYRRRRCRAGAPDFVLV